MFCALADILPQIFINLCVLKFFILCHTAQFLCTLFGERQCRKILIHIFKEFPYLLILAGFAEKGYKTAEIRIFVAVFHCHIHSFCVYLGRPCLVTYCKIGGDIQLFKIFPCQLYAEGMYGGDIRFLQRHLL